MAQYFDDSIVDKISKLINENLPNIPVWTDALNDLSEYNATRFHRETSIEEIGIITDRVASVLKNFSDIAIKYCSFKDTFDNSKMYLNLYGPSLIIQSNKTGIAFYLSADDTGVSLEARLSYIGNINYMDDIFWKNLLSLSDLGKFDLEESEFYLDETRKKYTPLYSSDKSIIFKLLRSYFVGATEEVRDIISGSLKITWISNFVVEDIIRKFCEAFKTLYNLNYALWKVTDLRDKKNNTAANKGLGVIGAGR